MSQNYNNSHTWANLLSIPPPPFIKFAARPPFYLISHSDATYISVRPEIIISRESPVLIAVDIQVVIIQTVQLVVNVVIQFCRIINIIEPGLKHVYLALDTVVTV